jgi:hypothetical protein
MDEQAQERDHCGSAYLISPLTLARMEFSVCTGHGEHDRPHVFRCAVFTGAERAASTEAGATRLVATGASERTLGRDATEQGLVR